MLSNGYFRYTIKLPWKFSGVILLVAIIYAVHLLRIVWHQSVDSTVLSIGDIKNKADPSKLSSLIYKPANNSHLVHSVASPTRSRSKKKHLSIKPIPVMVRLSSNLPTLPPDVISGIKKFAFFVGYPRSGHSIVGSILDAHPHIVMSNKLNFFEQLSFFNDDTPRDWAANLYNIIYQRSITDTQAGGLRNINSMSKGTHAISSLWQGKFDKYIQVLGDTSGPLWEFMHDRITFMAQYQEFMKKIGVPIKVLHLLRNPYDAIAAQADFVVGRKHVGNITTNTGDRKNASINNYVLLEKIITTYFYTSKAVMELIELIGRNNVLDIHLSDLIHNPKGTILSISSFLGVNAEDEYVQLCVEKVYKTTSRSRNLVLWPPELKMMVEHRMKGYKILQRYNFNSD